MTMELHLLFSFLQVKLFSSQNNPSKTYSSEQTKNLLLAISFLTLRPRSLNVLSSIDSVWVIKYAPSREVISWKTS